VNLAHHFRLVSWAAASKIPPVVYGFAFIIVLMTSLTPSQHGQYITVYSLFAITTLFIKNLIYHPMIHFAAAPGKLSQTVRLGFVLSGLFYLVFGSIIWFAAPVIAEMLRISTCLVRIVPSLMAAMFFREIGYCVQQTLYKTRNLFIIESVYFLGSAAGFIILASFGKLTTAYSALMVNLCSAAVSSIVVLFFGFKKVKIFGRIHLSEVKELLNYGWLTLGTGFSAFIMNGNADILLFGAIYTPDQVGFYNGAKHAYRLISNLLQGLALVIMPYASQLIAEKRFAELKATYEKFVGYAVVIVLGICTVGWIIAGKVYAILFAGEYLESTPMFRLMLVGATFEAIYTVSANVLYGAGRAGSVAIVSLTSVCVWLVVATPGIFFWGGMGSAAGLAAAMIFAGIWQHYIAAREYNTDIRQISGRLGRNLKSIVVLINSRKS